MMRFRFGAVLLLATAVHADVPRPHRHSSADVPEIRVLDSDSVELGWLIVANEIDPEVPILMYELAVSREPFTWLEWARDDVRHDYFSPAAPGAPGTPITCPWSGLRALVEAPSRTAALTVYVGVKAIVPLPLGGIDPYFGTPFPPVPLPADVMAPLPPAPLSGSAMEDGSVRLSWPPPEDPDSPSPEGRRCRGYRVECALDPAGSDRRDVPEHPPLPGEPGGPDDVLVVRDLATGTWTFWVSAIDEAGNSSQASSAMVSVVRRPDPPVAPHEPATTGFCSAGGSAAPGLLVLGILAGLASRRAMSR